MEENIMIIHRRDPQSGVELTPGRIKECLDLLEKAEEFNEGINWDTEIVPGLPLERLIQALISAEQELE